jgi:hypothetical protein
VIDYKLKQNIDTLIDSSFVNPFKDKWVSIIGDSISTFEGWTNASKIANYYSENTGNNSDVKRVEDTWWYILLKKLGAKLCVNCSISGARIYYSDTHSTKSLYERITNKEYIRQVGNTYINLDGSEELCESEVIPDYVIIFMGLNDWLGSEELGIQYLSSDVVSDYKVRIPFNLTNYKAFSDIRNTSVLGQYMTSLSELTSINSSNGNPIRVITLSPHTGGKGNTNNWRSGNSSNCGFTDYINSMKEISTDIWKQPFINSSIWIRGVNGELQDSTGHHPNCKLMQILAEGMYKNIMMLPN